MVAPNLFKFRVVPYYIEFGGFEFDCIADYCLNEDFIISDLNVDYGYDVSKFLLEYA